MRPHHKYQYTASGGSMTNMHRPAHSTDDNKMMSGLDISVFNIFFQPSLPLATQMRLSVILSFCIPFVSSQLEWSNDPFNPPSLPLAVKSPYINVWEAQGGQPSSVNEKLPFSWNASVPIGWDAEIRVDNNQSYHLLGTPDPGQVSRAANANQTKVIFTPTRTSILLKAGPIDVNMTFLSPIEAGDLTRLSMPFSYLYFSFTPNDNSAHDVQIYSDITEEWSTGNTNLVANWSMTDASDFIYLQMQPITQQKFHEFLDRPQDGVSYYCIKQHSGLSWEIGPKDDIRSAFVNGTGLQNRAEATFHVSNSPHEGNGIAVDIGTIEPGIESTPVVFAVGVVRDPVIQYTNGNAQVEERNAYYWANFSSIHDVIQDVLDHFDDALSASIEFDNKLLADANSISEEYAGLISLTTRQAMSAIEYTIKRDDLNISDVKAFMKNMGGVGSDNEHFQVNAVDVIYAAMPIYVYLNPDILGYLLNPLLEYHLNPQYTNSYAAKDLGGPFPNATGNNDVHNQGIEQSANMIILSLVHALTSSDNSLLFQYYDLFARWGEYLINNTLTSTDQITSSSDGITGANQTNLILKGIIGIRAMSEISSITGHNNDSTRFKAQSDQYYDVWETLAKSPSSIALESGKSGSGLIYNLYADKLLGFNMVATEIYDLQTSYYNSQTNEHKYGVPVDDSNSDVSRSDWMLFAASTSTNLGIQNAMISQVYNYANASLGNKPFSSIYNPIDGSQIGGTNSPAQGAIFAPLALSVVKNPSTTNPFTSPGTNNEKKRNRTGVIVGSVIGGMVLVSILIFILIYRRRHQNRLFGLHNKHRESTEPNSLSSHTFGIPTSNPSTTNMGQVDTTNHMQATPVPYPYLEPYSGESYIPAQRSGKSAPYYIPSNSSASRLGSNPYLDNQQVSGDRTNEQGSLRAEVDNLRMEVERLREENVYQSTSPPSYVS